jgi:tRNA dimethylallyltransferase
VLSSSVPILLVICGATATGKTGLAIALAKRLEAAFGQQSLILSADSRQVYREFTIGTAKPSSFELAQVRHALVDICDPRQVLTVAEYQAQARALIETCHREGVMPFLVGGTGLYLRSIVRGMKIPAVAPQLELRSQLGALGQAQCHAMLSQVDQVAADRIHPNDPVRTLRALEVFYVTGQPITAQQGEDPPDYPVLNIGLASNRLDDRIFRRAELMMEQGFVNEVKELVLRYGDDLPLLNTLGYAEVRQYLRNEIDLPEAKRLTALHTRQFAKRQRNWFRSDESIEWFDSDDEGLVDRVWERLQSGVETTQTKSTRLD